MLGWLVVGLSPIVTRVTWDYRWNASVGFFLSRKNGTKIINQNVRIFLNVHSFINSRREGRSNTKKRNYASIFQVKIVK